MKEKYPDTWLDYNIADDDISHINETILGEYTNEAYTKRVENLLNDHIKPGDRVLDIGCGVGKWVSYLLQRGIDCVGIDNSEVALIKAQHSTAKYKTTRVIFDADATDMPFQHDEFDAIISFGLIEHFPDHKDILGYWKQFLKPGGKIILSVPNGLRWDWMFADILFKWYKQKTRIKLRITSKGFISTNYGYEERWIPSYFRNLCLASGFQIISLTSYFTLSPLLFYLLGNRSESRLFRLLSNTKASKRWGLYLFVVAQK